MRSLLRPGGLRRTGQWQGLGLSTSTSWGAGIGSDEGTAQTVLAPLLQDSFLLLGRRIFLLLVFCSQTGVVGVSPGRDRGGADIVFLPQCQWLE